MDQEKRKRTRVPVHFDAPFHYRGSRRNSGNRLFTERKTIPSPVGLDRFADGPLKNGQVSGIGLVGCTSVPNTCIISFRSPSDL